jgi:hypothetical protein
VNAVRVLVPRLFVFQSAALRARVYRRLSFRKQEKIPSGGTGVYGAKRGIPLICCVISLAFGIPVPSFFGLTLASLPEIDCAAAAALPPLKALERQTTSKS